MEILPNILNVKSSTRDLTDEQFEVVDPIMPLFAIGTINEGRKFGVELTYEF